VQLALPEAARVLMCSDLHLQDEEPALMQQFLTWLVRHGAEADWLLLLGDVFDAWVGDDAMQSAHEPGAPPVWKELALALQRLRSTRFVQVGLMVGNRDFLMGPDACARLGAEPLSDFLVVSHPGLSQGSALLCHGDTLCIADTAYQAWRLQSRSVQWQQQFLARPLPDRLGLARELRAQSEQEKSTKPMAYMDVVPEEADRMLDHFGAGVLIHGHTHLPGCSQLPSGRDRWVLPDWSVQQGNLRGGGLRIDTHGISVVPF